MNKMERKKILAFVGMPGSGKSEAVAYLKSKGIPFVRFGDITDEGVRKLELSLTPENERMVREKLRHDFGMAAYAIKSESRINELLEKNDVIAIDGLYSWEEYVYLKQKFPQLILIQIYCEPKVRYERLAKRPIRPVSVEKSRERDITELEHLNKGGPIAISDYLIDNSQSDLNFLYQHIDGILKRIGI